MKIEKIYSQFRKDSEFETAKLVDKELRWMVGQIMEDYSKLWEMRKQLYYKEQMFRAFFKEKSGAFNNVCRIDEIIKAYNDGLLFYDSEKKKERTDIIKLMVVNFFPQWMWDGLEFDQAISEGYDTHGLELSFLWNAGKKKGAKKIEFMVCIPNPNTINTNEVYNPHGAFSNMEFIQYEQYKTKVYACRDPKSTPGGKSYDWVGDGYFNDHIRECIEHWIQLNMPDAMEKSKAEKLRFSLPRRMDLNAR